MTAIILSYSTINVVMNNNVHDHVMLWRPIRRSEISRSSLTSKTAHQLPAHTNVSAYVADGNQPHYARYDGAVKGVVDVGATVARFIARKYKIKALIHNIRELIRCVGVVAKFVAGDVGTSGRAAGGRDGDDAVRRREVDLQPVVARRTKRRPVALAV